MACSTLYDGGIIVVVDEARRWRRGNKPARFRISEFIGLLDLSILKRKLQVVRNETEECWKAIRLSVDL